MAKTGDWKRINELRKLGCKCKQTTDYKTADLAVKRGEAKWVVINQEFGTQEITCTFCLGHELNKRTCPQCKGTGKGKRKVEWNKYNIDIVLTTHLTKSNRHSTPRVPTIEKGHILRAYVEGNENALNRIEEYQRLTQHSLGELGAEVRLRLTRKLPKGAVIMEGKSEPEGNLKTGEGREYDYGRAI